MYVNDFDKNGTVEQLICTYNGDKNYPLVLRHDLMAQIPSLKKKYLKYESFKDQSINDIFTPEQMENAVKKEVYELASVILINGGSAGFEMRRLPIQAQFSVVYAIEVEDFNKDGFKDIVLGGNLYNVKPEVGQYDGSYGAFLKGDGKGNFTFIPTIQSGLQLKGEIRDLVTIKVGNEKTLIAARNRNTILTFKVNSN
jgi:hypothetical protein